MSKYSRKAQFLKILIGPILNSLSHFHFLQFPNTLIFSIIYDLLYQKPLEILGTLFQAQDFTSTLNEFKRIN